MVTFKMVKGLRSKGKKQPTPTKLPELGSENLDAIKAQKRKNAKDADKDSKRRNTGRKALSDVTNKSSLLNQQDAGKKRDPSILYDDPQSQEVERRGDEDNENKGGAVNLQSDDDDDDEEEEEDEDDDEDDDEEDDADDVVQELRQSNTQPPPQVVIRRNNTVTANSRSLAASSLTIKSGYENFCKAIGVMDSDERFAEQVKRTTRQKGWKFFKMLEEKDYQPDSSFVQYMLSVLGVDLNTLPTEKLVEQVWMKHKKYVVEGMQAARSSATQAIKKQFLGT